MNFLELIRTATAEAPPPANLRPVACPEWPALDGKLYVRRLDALARAEFYSAMSAQKASKGAAFYAFVCAFCACNGAGERGFADEAWQELQREPGSVIERIFDEADELNMLSDAARENVKKNFETRHGSGSINESPAKPESASGSCTDAASPS